ncbi:hypothetical protein [Lysinibacillus fusiformis]|uniref:hypothetical protein n=1 Tax=Lysinibacillus fusiformis TaxID=28031 RepID=UPI002E22B45B|nr:hypothetical protein [Lysinibacillus fusiformis]
MNVFEIVKSRVQPDTLSDNELLLKVEEVAQAIKTYCNRGDIPVDLKFVHVNMTLDLINYEIKSKNPSNFVVAKSVKEGDVAVELTTSTTTGEQVTMRLLTNYTPQLNRFRKLRW